MIWLILGKGIRGVDQLRCRKTKLYLNPMWPLFATNIAQYEKKSHHWASCHINYTHGPIIHENASFGDFKKMLSFGFGKQQMQKKDICSVSFFQSTGHCFYRWVMGWRLRLRTCYIGHLKHPLAGERKKRSFFKKKKKSIEVFFVF